MPFLPAGIQNEGIRPIPWAGLGTRGLGAMLSTLVLGKGSQCSLPPPDTTPNLGLTEDVSWAELLNDDAGTH